MTDILRTKAMLIFALFLIPKGGKNAPIIYPALTLSGPRGGGGGGDHRCHLETSFCMKPKLCDF